MPKAGSPGRRPISPTPSAKLSDDAPEPGDAPLRRRHYGRRKGPKLRARQAGLLETLLPALTLAPVAGLEPARYFAVPLRETWLEIGFGAGEHLAWQAEAHPEAGLIGAEPYVAGMAKLLARIAEKNLPNIRLYPEDARDVLAALPDASLARVFTLFPDPWPKTRHHKRRFLQTEMLDVLARTLKSGAELRFATDHADYGVWALERLQAHSQFRWLAQASEDWRGRAPDWPQTRYEAKAIKAGRAPLYLRFARL
jgi:tRNA (guanine-N7-)-methyltransferase